MTVINEKLKKEIGSRLMILREVRGSTREEIINELSKNYKLDIDEKTLMRYEKGTFIPKIDNLITLSEFYEVSLDYIIYGKQTSNDNAYSWKDSLKRLNRLVFSGVLIPWKDENPDSPFYGKYYFTAFDEEIRIYMERLLSFSENKNYSFEVRGNNPCFDISDWDNLIEDFESYTDDLSPSRKRMDDILKAAHVDPDKYLQNHLEAIMKKRK